MRRARPGRDPASPPHEHARVAALATILTLVALVGLAGTAAAIQDIAFRLECPNDAKTVQPASSPETWSCSARLDYSSGGTGLTDPLQAAIVSLDAPETPAWMDVSIAPSTIVSYGPAPGEETARTPVLVTVSLDPPAPAFETTRLEIEPTVEQHPREEGDLSTFASVTGADLSVTPGYVNNYEARIVTDQGQARPQDTLHYRVEIDNYSNGPTRFTFDLVNESPRGFTPLPPEPVLVPAATTGNQTGANATLEPGHASIPFQVQTPYRNGYIDEHTPVHLIVSSAYAPDPSVTGEQSVLTTYADSKGVYVPGPSTLGLALATLTGALFAARRRPDGLA